jgi:hypothetical protein
LAMFSVGFWIFLIMSINKAVKTLIPTVDIQHCLIV